eukprot:3234582-Rhodomonas_salina.1
MVLEYAARLSTAHRVSPYASSVPHTVYQHPPAPHRGFSCAAAGPEPPTIRYVSAARDPAPYAMSVPHVTATMRYPSTAHRTSAC